jgi:histidyl-tRNA synthetase
MCRQWWKRLGIDDVLTLELNTIGSGEARQQYKAALTDYLRGHFDALDDDSQRRLDTNPLRILDSKSESTQSVLKEAPAMSTFLDDESREHHDRLCELLSLAGLSFVPNPNLVRGLDYYNKTVFEWTTDKLGAQATVCGGGRYDAMVSQFGGRDTAGCGFAAGLERLILLLQALEVEASADPDLYIISSDENALGKAMLEADRIRSEFPTLNVVQHLGGGSFKSQFKRADKSGAAWAMVFGEEEVAQSTVTLKPLRSRDEQMTLDREGLNKFLAQLEAWAQDDEE